MEPTFFARRAAPQECAHSRGDNQDSHHRRNPPPLRSRRGGRERARSRGRSARNLRRRLRSREDRAAPGIGVALQPLQVGAHVGGGLVAQAWVLLQRLVDQVFQLGRNLRIEPHRRDRRFVQDGIEHRCAGVAAKRQCARQHLVENRAEGKQVGAHVQFLAQRLLGRHVGRRTHRRARAGQVLRRHRQGRRSSRRGHDGLLYCRHLRQSEVEHLGMPALGDQDVRRLDVAVDDPLCVRRIQRVGDLDSQVQHLLHRHRCARDQVFERGSVQVFHDDERTTLGFIDLVNRADVGMVQRRGGKRLAPEPLQRRSVLRQIVGQELQGHMPRQLLVFGVIDHTHAAAAQLGDNSIVGNGCVDQMPFTRGERIVLCSPASAQGQQESHCVSSRPPRPTCCASTSHGRYL